MGYTHRSLPSSWWKARNGRFLRSGKLWHSVISHNCQPIICGLLRGVIKWFICQSRRYGISEQQMVNRNGIRWRRVVLGVFDFLFEMFWNWQPVSWRTIFQQSHALCCFTYHILQICIYIYTHYNYIWYDVLLCYIILFYITNCFKLLSYRILFYIILF